MMRRLILIFGSMVLATIAFLGYLWWQSPETGGGAQSTNHLQPTTLETSDKVGGIGQGTGVWIKQYDKDGDLSSILRAQRYVPRQNGTVVDVVEPEAEFFLSGGRRMVLNGDRGVINVEQRPSAQRNSGLGGGGETAPTSGFLYNVVIRVFEAATPDVASMTLRTNNISFDNQTFKIATEDFVDSYGQSVKADQVPVSIRGTDVDFDGRGLIARYDDLNQRIATLQITHGEQMVIKRSDLLAKPPTTKPTTQSAAMFTTAAGRVPPAAQVAAPAQHVGSALADAPVKSAKADPTKTSPTKPVATKSVATTTSAEKLGPTAYRATFLEDVRVTQGDQPMAEADVMAIDFFPAQGRDKATTKPATRATKAPPVATRAPVHAATAVADSSAPSPKKSATSVAASTKRSINENYLASQNDVIESAPMLVAATNPSSNPSTAPTSQASTKPATNPSTQPAPIVVHWKGTLRMVAIDQNTVVPLAPGEMAMTATGAPLVLHQPQGVVHCGSMLYQSRDNAVRLLPSATTPIVTFVDTTGQTTLTTHTIDYSDAGRLAVLTGESSLHMVQPKQGTKPETELLATWKDRCTAKLFPGSGSAVKQIDLAGDVDVKHPQLKMKSQTLSLAFSPDELDVTKSDLHQVTATGDVDCDLSAPENPARRLRGDKVVVGMGLQPSGSIYPQTIDASGSVHANDGDQSIVSDVMQVTLAPKPTTRPATKPANGSPIDENAVAEQTELKTFHANGAVTMISKDGTATADSVSVDQTTGKQVMELRGSPAVLTQQGRTITGPVIVAQPDDGLARVDGPGTLHAMEEDSTKHGPTATTRAAAPPTVPPANSQATRILAHAPNRATTGPANPTTKPARPVDLAWAGGANFNGPGNLVTFRDKVVIHTTDADGTARVTHSDAMAITLKSAPTTQPAKKITSATQPGQRVAIKPATKPVASDAFKDKVVSAVTLTGNVSVESTLNGASGELIKRTLLQTEKLTANLDDAQQLTSVDIPVAGQALIDDHKPTTRPSDPKEGGATAVEWKKGFHYDQALNSVATLYGDVHVHHDALTGPGTDSLDLTSSKVIITFGPEPKSPTTRQATTMTSHVPVAVGVQQVFAVAPVTFTARDIEMTAQTLQYTPSNFMMIISGTDRLPVEVVNVKDQTRGQFEQVWYNTQTQLPERMTKVGVQGGR